MPTNTHLLTIHLKPFSNGNLQDIIPTKVLEINGEQHTSSTRYGDTDIDGMRMWQYHYSTKTILSSCYYSTWRPLRWQWATSLCLLSQLMPATTKPNSKSNKLLSEKPSLLFESILDSKWTRKASHDRLTVQSAVCGVCLLMYCCRWST